MSYQEYEQLPTPNDVFTYSNTTIMYLYEVKLKDEKDKVIAAGGLKIIGSERHESRRIDNQLRGRAGRQGDIGESRFYIS